MDNELLVAEKRLDENGFLDVDIDPTLDLFAEIEKLKKKRTPLSWPTCTRNRISRT